MTTTDKTLEGKIALVTGAATGIGAALAKELAAAGAHVIGADIAWKQNASSPGIEQVHCDVADPSSVQACVSQIEVGHGGVDILVNNAALAAEIAPGPFEQITPDEWTRVLTVNTLSQFLCSKAVTPQMRKKKWGRIVNLTSGTVFVGTPYMLHYVASKGAIVAMTRSLAAEVGRDGITVNAIAPGAIATRLTGLEDIDPHTVKRPMIPAGRPGDAREVAAAIAFLAGEGASYVTGHSLVVDGGMLLMAADANRRVG